MKREAALLFDVQNLKKVYFLYYYDVNDGCIPAV